MKKKLVVFLLILSCGIFMGLKLQINKITREKIPGSSIIYIPSGKYLKFASFGYSSFIADLIYIWAIQYYSNYSIPDRYDNLDHIFSIIAELDHRYLDPYEIGAMIAVYEAKDLSLAFKILDKGLEKNPDQWIFPLQAGHYAQMMTKDYELARKYYKKTMEMDGAPVITRRLYANAAFKIMDYKTAWENWLEIYQTTEDQRIKKIASNQLYQVKAAIDVKTIKEAIEKFKERFGRNPTEQIQLVKHGLLDSLPKDLDGKEYIYNSQTGEIRAPMIWWKR
ncbi:MAG: hypothetical protein E3J76_04365 [Candidatus Aminicenantes bacterium]|nr:MAG: hypothetical protein E3J76_04365 [Candidatus Aminicenantes bacterium]